MKRLAITVCVLALAAPAAAQDATGKWELTVTTTQREPRKTSMVLKKDGEKLSGTIVGPQNVELAVAGSQTGADVALSFNVTTQNGPIAISMKGRQDGDSLKGTLEVGTGEDRGDWTATRAAAAAASSGPAAVDMTGTWAFEVVSDGGTGTPVVTLKQTGEKLSGHYKGMFGEAPLTGHIKGNAFSFETTMTIEGNSVTLTYSGNVNDGTASGRVVFGSFGEGTFKGTREGTAGR